jgi:hypothetical protein
LDFEVAVDIKTVVNPGSLLTVDRRNALMRTLLHTVPFGLIVGVIFASKTSSAALVATWVAFTVAVSSGLAGTTWGRWFVLVRVALPLAGRLPWRLLVFLDDAHRRGVLRQSGAVYQFRHSRLQQRLAHAADLEPHEATVD